MLASRGSRLARAQTDLVADMLRRRHEHLEIEVVPVTTSGDVDRRPFRDIGGKGLFVKEVERAVVEGRADAAIHSAKDLTAELAPGCVLACIPARAERADVVLGGVGASGDERLATLPPGATVGTSSMRRRALVAEAHPDLDVVDFRGNLDTRVRKVEAGEVDAAIVAAAGLERLGTDVDAARLDPARWVPAPAQGALAVETLEERDDLVEVFGALNVADASAEVACERAFAARLEGGCSVPLGCSAEAERGGLRVTAYLASPDGMRALRDRVSGPAATAETLGRELADAILRAGGDEILEEVRASEATAPSPP